MRRADCVGTAIERIVRSTREELVRGNRQTYSEGTILQREAKLDELRRICEAVLDLDRPEVSYLRDMRMVFLAKKKEIQDLLDRNALEHALQQKLYDLLEALGGKVHSEVRMAKSSGFRGMRLDLAVGDRPSDRTLVLELKRAKHTVVSPNGKRLVKGASAIAQTQDYADRLMHDAVAIGILREAKQLNFTLLDVRLVAGRRPRTTKQDSELKNIERELSKTRHDVLLYSWDGLLAELEGSLW